MLGLSQQNTGTSLIWCFKDAQNLTFPIEVALMACPLLNMVNPGNLKSDARPGRIKQAHSCVSRRCDALRGASRVKIPNISCPIQAPHR